MADLSNLTGVLQATPQGFDGYVVGLPNVCCQHVHSITEARALLEQRTRQYFSQHHQSVSFLLSMVVLFGVPQ